MDGESKRALAVHEFTLKFIWIVFPILITAVTFKLPDTFLVFDKFSEAIEAGSSLDKVDIHVSIDYVENAK